MSEMNVKHEKEGRTGYIILARPEKKNALNDVMITLLTEALKSFESDNQVSVIVLKAEGDTFSAGADLEYLNRLRSFTYEQQLADSKLLQQLYESILQIPKPVIAQVEGAAIAGGCGLATACDFCFATPEAKFGYPESKIGFVPALVSVILLKKIRGSDARQLLLSGELITAERAKQIGLISELVDKSEIAFYVKQFAERLATETSSNSLAVIKKLLNEVSGLDYASGFKRAAELNAEVRMSEDFKKGITAFLNKQKPQW